MVLIKTEPLKCNNFNSLWSHLQHKRFDTEKERGYYLYWTRVNPLIHKIFWGSVHIHFDKKAQGKSPASAGASLVSKTRSGLKIQLARRWSWVYFEHDFSPLCRSWNCVYTIGRGTSLRTIRQKCYLGQLTQVNLVLGRYVHSNEQHKNVPQVFLEAQRNAINICILGLWGGCLYGVLGVGILEFMFGRVLSRYQTEI